MGYDFTVTKGSVRLAEAPGLTHELLEFAVQLEMEVIPVNWMISGIIPDHERMLRNMFGEPEAEHLVSRPVIKRTGEVGQELPWYAIDREHVQGIVFCHHYEEWIFTWNVSRGGLLGRYFPIPSKPVDRFFDQGQTVAPKSLLASLDAFINSKPIELCGEISEDHINIHCPWRRNDVIAACDLLKSVSSHCDNFNVKDDYGIWPNKDFTKWKNLAGGYADLMGGKPAHPDIADEL